MGINRKIFFSPLCILNGTFVTHKSLRCKRKNERNYMKNAKCSQYPCLANRQRSRESKQELTFNLWRITWLPSAHFWSTKSKCLLEQLNPAWMDDQPKINAELLLWNTVETEDIFLNSVGISHLKHAARSIWRLADGNPECFASNPVYQSLRQPPSRLHLNNNPPTDWPHN